MANSDYLSTATREREKHLEVTATKPDGSRPPSNPVPERDIEFNYPNGIKLATILMSLGVFTFLVALDNTIVGTAIPKITDEFGALDDVGWYGSAYLFTLCAFQLFFGKLFTLFPIKYVYLCSVTVFEVGSAVCGAAPNSTAFIIGRAIAGIGAAGDFSGGLIIIAHSVPLEKRPKYIGLLGASWGIACVAGPLLGGVLTDKVSWRWCFYINLPMAVLAIVGPLFAYPSRHHEAPISVRWKQKLARLDPLGTVTFMPGVLCCLLALQWGGSKYHWDNARIIVLFILAGILLIAFGITQKRVGNNATVPTRVARQRSMIAAMFMAFCIGGVMFIFVYFLPIWFQAIKGVSAWKSGVMLLPFLLGVILMSIIAGIAVTNLGYYVPAMVLSSILMSIGAGLLTTFQTSTNHPVWIGYQVLLGFGVGMGMQQPIVCAQTVLHDHDVSTGTCVIMLMQSLGGALSLAISNNVFVNRLTHNLARIPGIDGSVVQSMGTTDLNLGPAVRSAYNNALTKTWYVAVALAAISILGASVAEWRSVKEGQNSAPVADRNVSEGEMNNLA